MQGQEYKLKRMKNARIKEKYIFKSLFYYNTALLTFIKTQAMLLAISQRQYIYLNMTVYHLNKTVLKN